MPKVLPLRDARLAVSLLTVVPTGVDWPVDGDTQVAAWFPAVGVCIGAVGWGLAHVATRLGEPARAPYLVAALIVAVWAVCTRGLHWDGLADVADAYWGSHDPPRRLEIMADSTVGAFGGTAIVLVAVVEVAALGAILSISRELPLLIVPIVARFSATAAAWLGSPARPGGLGRSVMGRPTIGGLVIASLPLIFALAAMSWAYGAVGATFAAAGLLLALVVPHLIARRFGGVTGDVMGASVLLTETLLFAVFALLP